MKRKVIEITITERCNLNCIYCYEHNRNNDVMSIDLVKQIITRSFAEEYDADFLEFDLHGGEIALVFNYIKEICDWTWNRKWNKPYVFHATTNGTLIHGQIQKWFKENAQRFNLGLSLDGNKMMHDINRSKSYDSIDLNFFHDTYPEQPVKMTISPQSLPYLFNGIIDIYKKGFNVSANLAYGPDWNKQELKRIYYEELLKLVGWYLEHPQIPVCSLLSDRGFDYIGYIISNNYSQTHRKWCGVGENLKCFSVEGYESPCQMFNPSSFNTRNTQKIDLDFSTISLDNVCSACPILPICPTCYGKNFIRNLKLIKKPDEMCDFVKIESLASSFLYGKMLFETNINYKAISDYNNEKKAYTIIGIKHIQNEVTIKF